MRGGPPYPRYTHDHTHPTTERTSGSDRRAAPHSSGDACLRLREVEGERGFLPIATAPRTGEHILVAALGKEGFGLCGGKRQDTSAVVHWWSEPGEEGWYLSLGNCDDRQDWPTHWTPIAAAESRAGKLAEAARAAMELLAALDISIEWELAPPIKARIKKDAEALRSALAEFEGR